MQISEFKVTFTEQVPKHLNLGNGWCNRIRREGMVHVPAPTSNRLWLLQPHDSDFRVKNRKDFWDNWCLLVGSKKLAVIKKTPRLQRWNLLGSEFSVHKKAVFQRQMKVDRVIYKDHSRGYWFWRNKGSMESNWDAWNCERSEKANGKDKI